MNHEDVKQLLLKNSATSEAYAHPPQALVVARTVVLRRRALGMTKEMLAERLGTTIDDISAIESGHDLPARGMLKRLATVLQEPGLQAMALSGTTTQRAPVRYDASKPANRRSTSHAHGRRGTIGRDAKRDTSTGRFMDVKKDGRPFKSVRKKK